MILPINNMVLDVFSLMMMANGRSQTNLGVEPGPTDVTPTAIVVTAAASVPSSSTAAKVFCFTKLT